MRDEKGMKKLIKKIVKNLEKRLQEGIISLREYHRAIKNLQRG